MQKLSLLIAVVCFGAIGTVRAQETSKELPPDSPFKLEGDDAMLLLAAPPNPDFPIHQDMRAVAEFAVGSLGVTKILSVESKAIPVPTAGSESSSASSE